MDEELIEVITEDNAHVELEGVVESEVLDEDFEQSIDAEIAFEIAEIEVAEEIEVEIDESVAWTGGDNMRHYSLYGRDEADQHPISAITGLRDELNEIESLKTVYSDKTGFANYYKWHDGAHDEYGYFVSIVHGTNNIQICNRDDIFGVTVDVAGFVGNQSDFARGNDYALVATSGLVQVRCESDVTVGDYVVCNSVGIAEKTTSSCGYKVVAIDNSTGVSYAEISLGVQVHITDLLEKKVQVLDDRVDDVEINVIYAMNTANDAYNMSQKAINSNNSISDQVDSALNSVEDIGHRVGDLNSQVENISSTVAKSQAIVDSAVTSAEASRIAAEKAANESLANVNDLIDTLEPIITWEDPETGNVGAEYFTTYIENGLATKVEVQTVENLTGQNKRAIEENAELFRQTLSSVDKYSVGEYSQSYGLTYKQAVSILTDGMIYIPTSNFFACCDKHKDGVSHCETFSDIEDSDKATNEFTPGYHYVWSKNEDGELDWVEGIGEVVFLSTNVPVQSGNLKYWYIDSNTAPKGYEPYALYIWENEQWIKVNLLEFNRENRIVSMIQQDVNGLSAEVVNARGDAASLSVRLDSTEATVSSTAAWVKGTTTDGKKLCNIATIDQSADQNGSSLALVVADVEGNKILNGASIVLGQGDDDSYIQVDADHINFEAENFTINADHIDFKTSSFTLTASNGGSNSTSSTISINQNNMTIASARISFSGMVTFSDLRNKNSYTTINGSNITTGTIQAIDIDACTITSTLLTGESESSGQIKMYDEESDKVVGGIRLDNQGADNDVENKYRMFVYTTGDFSLKLESEARLSLESSESSIHIEANSYANLWGNTVHLKAYDYIQLNAPTIKLTYGANSTTKLEGSVDFADIEVLNFPKQTAVFA